MGTAETSAARWQIRIDAAERTLRGDRRAQAELHDEVSRLTDDEHLLDTPAAADSMSYFVAMLRELGRETQNDYVQVTEVISDWVRNNRVPAPHVCTVHNRMATVLAESGKEGAAQQALGAAWNAAQTPWDRACTLIGQSVLELQLGEWDQALRHAGQAESLISPADSGEAWLDIRMQAAFVHFRAQQATGAQDQQAVQTHADYLVTVCSQQIDRWGDDHPRALEALTLMAAASHVLGEMQDDIETMTRAADVLEVVAQRSSTLLGTRHPQSISARAALEQVWESRTPPTPSPPPLPPPAVVEDRQAPQRLLEQFGQIQRSMPDVSLALGPDDAAEFIYEKGVVLARDGEQARLVEDTVRTYFIETTGLNADLVRRISPETNRSGVTRIQVGDPGHGDRRGDRAVTHALRALREQEARAGFQLISRNHVVSIAGSSSGEPVPAPFTQATNPAAAGGVYDADSAIEVLIIDNGLTHDYGMVPLLAHVQGDLHGTETDERGNLLPYVGHGTFIAGLLAAVAPNTNITVRNTLNDAGAVLESEFGQRLFDAVDHIGWPDIISLSAGTSNGRTDGLLGVESFMQELHQYNTLLVAAAGDNASATPFWPAAYASLPDYQDAVLAVGALRNDGEFGACFTNHGAWVSAFAPGELLTSTLTGFDAPVPYIYQHSTYDACRHGFLYACTCQYPRHRGALSEADTPAQPDQVLFEGYARWSGTSFAAALAAGMVAACMTADKENDIRAARDRLLSRNAAKATYAEMRGGLVQALIPPTWTAGPVTQLSF